MDDDSNRASPRIELKSDGEVDTDVDARCMLCGYNLRGLSLDGRCPECGTLIVLSWGLSGLAFSDRGWLRRLRFGVGLTAVGQLGGVMLLVYPAASPSRTWLHAVTILGVLGCLGASVVGTWFLTAFDPGRTPRAGSIWIRWGVVCGATIVFAGMLMGCLWWFAQPAQALSAVSWTAIAAGTAVRMGGELRVLRDLARRIPSRRLIRWTTWVLRGTVLTAAAVLVLECVGRGYVLPGYGNDDMVMLGTAGGAVIGMILFIQYLGLLAEIWGALQAAIKLDVEITPLDPEDNG